MKTSDPNWPDSLKVSIASANIEYCVTCNSHGKSSDKLYLRCISFVGETLREMEATSQQVGVHDIRLADMDVRFQCLETANYEGVLLWKVTDYARRKQDAFQNRVSSMRYTIKPHFNQTNLYY